MISAITGWILSTAWPWILAALGALGLWAAGRANGKATSAGRQGKLTMNMLLKSVIALSVISLTGCERWTGAGSATANEICRQIGAALPTRSHDDTAQTVDEITALYATFALTCPDWDRLVP